MSWTRMFSSQSDLWNFRKSNCSLSNSLRKLWTTFEGKLIFYFLEKFREIEIIESSENIVKSHNSMTHKRFSPSIMNRFQKFKFLWNRMKWEYLRMVLEFIFILIKIRQNCLLPKSEKSCKNCKILKMLKKISWNQFYAKII